MQQIVISINLVSFQFQIFFYVIDEIRMGNAYTRDTGKDATVLTDDEMTLLLNNTSFDREEILDWHKGFLVNIGPESPLNPDIHRNSKLIKEHCPNGKMNREQFLAFYTKLYPNGNASKFCRQVFKVFDTNGNGVIEFKELMMVISVTTLGDVRKKLELAFVLYDLDRNGLIDKREMEKIVESIYDLLDSSAQNGGVGSSVASDRVSAIMAKLDKNNDQVLSREEFISGCLSDPNIREILVPYA